ncbi:MAG: hypothetical protein ABSF15_01265 [Candidatus Sulfotelmatobacter sp.]|jgi:hypothetical protein
MVNEVPKYRALAVPPEPVIAQAGALARITIPKSLSVALLQPAIADSVDPTRRKPPGKVPAVPAIVRQPLSSAMSAHLQLPAAESETANG